jgi:hypothetical protein
MPVPYETGTRNTTTITPPKARCGAAVKPFEADDKDKHGSRDLLITDHRFRYQYDYLCALQGLRRNVVVHTVCVFRDSVPIPAATDDLATDTEHNLDDFLTDYFAPGATNDLVVVQRLLPQYSGYTVCLFVFFESISTNCYN